MPEALSASGGTAGTPGNPVAKPGVSLGVIVAIASVGQFKFSPVADSRP